MSNGGNVVYMGQKYGKEVFIVRERYTLYDQGASPYLFFLVSIYVSIQKVGYSQGNENIKCLQKICFILF